MLATKYRVYAPQSFVLATLLLFWGGGLQAISCKDVDRIMTLFFKNHLSVHEHSPQLTERAVENFIKALDPGKVYLLESDVAELHKKHLPNLMDRIAKDDCTFMTDVFSTYSKRFDAAQLVVKQLIDAKHDFTKDESLDLNRKTMKFATNAEDIKERWRKRVKFQLLQLKNTLGKEVANKENTARQKLHKRYELLGKRHRETTNDEVREYFLAAFASSLDPQTDYFSAGQLEEFRIGTSLSLEGIGAELLGEDGITTIRGIVPGGAAGKDGRLMVGDKIIAVGDKKTDMVEILDMELTDVVKLIRGTKGTRVFLLVKRGSEDLSIDLVREKISLPDRAAKSTVFNIDVQPMVAAAETKLDPKTTIKIGVIHLPSFYIDFEGRQANQKDFKSSSKDVAREIEQLTKKNVDLVIMDLRANGGGSLDEAINMSGLFLGPAPIVQVSGKQSESRALPSRGKAIYQGPLMVTIDQRSASASEIMAGAIQDFERGLVVGNAHSFGKGSVQNVVDLDHSLGALKVTISKFYRVSGASTQLKGVVPNVTIPGMMDLYEVGEKYYDYPLQWDQIAPQRYRTFGKVLPYVDKLQVASSARIKSSPDFLKLYQGMKEFTEKEQERYLVSLKETKEPIKKATPDEEILEPEDTSKTFDIAKDIHLQEYLRIGADYVRLLRNEDITRPETVVIAELAALEAKETSKANDSKASPNKDKKKAIAPAK